VPLGAGYGTVAVKVKRTGVTPDNRVGDALHAQRCDLRRGQQGGGSVLRSKKAIYPTAAYSCHPAVQVPKLAIVAVYHSMHWAAMEGSGACLLTKKYAAANTQTSPN
jgi:hypothetical protein